MSGIILFAGVCLKIVAADISTLWVMRGFKFIFSGVVFFSNEN